MKTSKLFLALALPMAFVACTNDDFTENNSQQVADGNLVELGDNFVLAVQGASDAQTRGIWEAGEGTNFGWSWIPTLLSDVTEANNKLGAALNVASDEIGLCWTGELADGTGSLGQRVYTNYQFIHDGWLAEGEKEAKINKCELTLENGMRYSFINTNGLSASSTLDQIKTKLTGDDNKVNINGTQKALNLNTGIFKTENKAIFGGSYIVYYPYNDQFADAGYIPATGTVAFTDVVTNGVDVTSKDALAQRFVAENSFLVGYAKNLIGGSEASQFSLNQLSGIISLQMIGTTGISKTLTKVALYSKDGFVKNVGLDASKIATMGANGGTALYVDGTKETVSTIVADIAVSSQATLSSESKQIMYLPVLPTTAKDVEAILYASDGTIARVAVADELTVAPASGKIVIVKVSNSDFKDNVKIAVDEASLIAAVGSTAPAKATTIEVIGDIRLTKNLTVFSKITVEGDKIIVPEGKTLTLADNSTIKSDVVVEGKGCCSKADVKGGILSVGGATISGNVTVEAGEATPVAAGTINFINKGAVVANTAVIETVGQVNFTVDAKDVVINGTLTLSEDAVAEVAEGAVVAVKGGTINNNGTFEVKGDFSMLDASGSTVAEAGEKFVNNGTFIDNVGAIVGGATQSMVFGEKGDYICKVDGNQRMNEAYENKTACSTIEIVSNSKDAYTFDKIAPHHDKDVNILVSGSNVYFKPKKDIKIGNLTISDKDSQHYELYIYGIEGSTKYGSITVNGDITVGAVFGIEEDVKNLKANNLKVIKGGQAIFQNRIESQDKTLEVSGTIEVQKDGKFTIVSVKPGQNTAYVTCTKLIEGGTFNGKPIVVKN